MYLPNSSCMSLVCINHLISWYFYSYFWVRWLLLTRKNDLEWHVPKIAYYVDMTKLLYPNRRTIFHLGRQANYVDLIYSRWLILSIFIFIHHFIHISNQLISPMYIYKDYMVNSLYYVHTKMNILTILTKNHLLLFDSSSL